MKNEFIIKGEQPKWGFPKPTVIIDSQSASPLRGIEAEQIYYRMYLMGKPGDKVLVNYPIDSAYLTYLEEDLKIPMPEIVEIPNSGTGFLTGDISAQPESFSLLQNLTHKEGYKVQFFSLTPDEVVLAKKLDNPTYIQDLDMGEKLGKKTGFREFCNENAIPMPPGNVCNGIQEIKQTIEELGDNDIFIKSYAGTGGTELGSNIQISSQELVSNKNDLDNLLANKMAKLSPLEPPYVVEKKLDLPEASLHIFLDNDGKTVLEPTVFGQFAHDGSYVGGHYPNGFTTEFNEKIKKVSEKIIAALKQNGITGMHCMDFLYDAQTNDFYFIEDNTRPGALDFISHFVNKVTATHSLANPAWYHYNLPIKEIAGKNVSFEEVMNVLGDSLIPGDSFVLVSNPNVLPYGGNLHLTGVSTGNSSTDFAKQAFEKALDKLKVHYGYNDVISIP